MTNNDKHNILYNTEYLTLSALEAFYNNALYFTFTLDICAHALSLRYAPVRTNPKSSKWI